MPTGYTAKLYEGAEQSFEEFVWSCVRAMGVAVTMRDDPLDKPVPERFGGHDSYYEKRIAEHEAEWARLENMSLTDCDDAAELEYETERGRVEEANRKDAELRSRYESMLAQVLAWEPPTTEHEGLKKFMADQLTESIRFDTGHHRSLPSKKTGTEWRRERIERLTSDLEYARKHLHEERERAEGRNDWLRALRLSVPQPQKVDA